MLVREFLVELGGIYGIEQNCTIIKATFSKVDPKVVYSSSPIKSIEDLLSPTTDFHKDCLDGIVVCPTHAPLDITGTVSGWYNSGSLCCFVYASRVDIESIYPKSRVNEMVEYYDSVAKEYIEGKEQSNERDWY